MFEVAEALALSLPEMLKSSVLMVKGELEELAVELPPANKLKSMSETLAPPRD